jgi:hypothetical protein
MAKSGPKPGMRLRFRRILECFQNQGINLKKKLPANFIIPENYSDITRYEFELVADGFRNKNVNLLFPRLFPDLKSLDVTTDEESIKPPPDVDIDSLPLEVRQVIRDALARRLNESPPCG